MNVISPRQPLVQVTPRGLYCPRGDFYIDPWEGVDVALITHAHSDHAREGSKLYHITEQSLGIIQRRLGPDGVYHPHAYRQEFFLGDVKISFHPAGHILGSAQIRLECDGEVWVVSGDYKRDYDPTCEAFEVVPCDYFITESTFGLPVFVWKSIEEETEAVYKWWMKNQEVGKNCILGCYSLGKSQRVLHALAAFTDQPVLLHGATQALVDLYREQGVPLIATLPATDFEKGTKGQLILAPPAAISSTWARKFGTFESGFASGWMRIRGNRRRKAYDQGFVISDHADWPALLQTVKECGAKKIYVTHGYTDELSRFLVEQGHDAEPLETLFAREEDA
ncbi:MAG: ligase-associated DNA damage response exonuclease [Proteobacteria bacterium]|nr:MAG: ligase-associated DNA damage response exonuclease [Pseudomonadota bacterium]